MGFFGRTKIIYKSLTGEPPRAPLTPRQKGIRGQKEREVAKGSKLSNGTGDGKTRMRGQWGHGRKGQKGTGKQ